MSSQQRTVEQQRAAQAWNYVTNLPGRYDANKYGTLARKLPSSIQANGLGQTLAFLLAKAKGKDDEHQAIYNHLSAWVMLKLGQKDDAQYKLLEWIITQPSSTYRRAATEAMAFAHWLKRFAEAQGLGETEEQ